MPKAPEEKSKLDKLMGMVETLVSKVSNLESENETLKRQVIEGKVSAKGKKFKITGMGNDVESDWKTGVDERNLEAEEHPQPVNLQKEAGFKGLEDACPYCISEDKESLLDLSIKTGRFQCRGCGKTFDKRLIGLPYAEEMENGQFDTKLLNAYIAQCKLEKVTA